MDDQNKYQLQTKIGEGAFGSVFIGLNQQTQTKVVIKVIKKEILKTSTQKKAVKREISIPKFLGEHKNIIRLIESISTPTQILIVSEYLEGSQSLHKIEKSRLDLTIPQNFNNLLEMMLQLVNGLNYMHSKNVVHRDIKPHNIIFKGNRPIFIDFEKSSIVTSTQFPCLKGFHGTPNYISPEGWRETVIDYYASDIYSLGVVFYFLCNKKKLPYGDVNDIHSLKKMVLNTDPIASQSGFQILDDLIMNLISKNPHNRSNLLTIKQTFESLCGPTPF